MKMKRTTKAKATAAPKAPRPVRGVSLWVYAGGLALAAVLALGLVTVHTLRTAQDTQAAVGVELDQQASRFLTQALEQRLQAEFASLAALAASPRVQDAFASGELETLQSDYAPAFAGALRLLAVPAGVSEPNLELNPPLGYALLEMMRRAEHDKKPQPAEVHLPRSPDAHVNLLQPVLGADGQVMGHLVASYPQAFIQAPLAGVKLGKAELRQSGATLVESGQNGGGATLETDIPRSRWQLAFTGTPRTEGILHADLLLIPALALLGLVLALLGAFYALGRALRGDGETAAQILRDAQQHKVKPDYPARLTESRAMLSSLAVEARRMDEQRPVVPVVSEARRDVSDELPPDITSGLLVDEEPMPPPAPTPPPAPKAKPKAPKPAAAAAALEQVEPSTPAEPLLRDTEMEFLLPDDPVARPDGVKIDPVILRAYDIRGIVGTSLNAQVVRALGQAIGSVAALEGQQDVVVGRDGRLSSPELAEALIEGLVAAGRDVIDIGQVPTPVMNFATFHLGTGAGVMVTGSHNPKDYNGLKIVIGGKTLSAEAIRALGKRASLGDFVHAQGSVRHEDVVPAYIERIVQDVSLHRPLRIVVDCGNGVAGGVAPQVFRAMGCEVEELFCEVDGYFPNHHPDPTVPENLEAMISLVRLQGADLGLAFDGDGDRLGVVDGKGRILWADRQLMLFARDVLERHPGGDIVFDVKCSARLAEVITESAGVPVMWKSGHSMIRNKLHELEAPLGGDMSGHIFFKDRWYGFDDAIYAGARLLEILSTDERKSTEIFAELPESASTPEIRLDLREGEAERIMDALESRLQQDFPEARIITLDGLRVELAEGWGLVRASNTQPALVLRFEGEDKAALGRIQEEFRKRLLAVKPDLQLPF